LKTEIIKINPQNPNPEGIIRCAKIIRQGGLVVFPTETVYGIAVDSSNEAAVSKLREVKKRPEAKPFSVLVYQKDLIAQHTTFSKLILYKLIDKYWPGPLTVVVPSKVENETIGVRMPSNNIALRLAYEAQCTIVATSANLDGKPEPATCKDALVDLDGLVDIAIDGGKSEIGKGSTVVDLTKDAPTILREGSVSKEDIEKISKTKTVLFVCTGNSCRSVMAEYLLRDAAKDRDDIESVSAGTGVLMRTQASLDAVAILKEDNIDATNHLSQPLTSLLLKKADLICVMTRAHRSQILDRIPEVEKRIYLLKEFSSLPSEIEENQDVPDPIGTSRESYRECFNIIKKAVNKIVGLI